MSDPYDVFRMGLPRASRADYAKAQRATVNGQRALLDKRLRVLVRTLPRPLRWLLS